MSKEKKTFEESWLTGKLPISRLLGEIPVMDLFEPIYLARDVLHGWDEIKLLINWKKIQAIFLRWKADCGQTPYYGGGPRFGLTPFKYEDKDAPPWFCAGPLVRDSSDLLLFELLPGEYAPFQEMVDKLGEDIILATFILGKGHEICYQDPLKHIHEIKEVLKVGLRLANIVHRRISIEQAAAFNGEIERIKEDKNFGRKDYSSLRTARKNSATNRTEKRNAWLSDVKVQFSIVYRSNDDWGSKRIADKIIKELDKDLAVDIPLGNVSFLKKNGIKESTLVKEVRVMLAEKRRQNKEAVNNSV